MDAVKGMSMEEARLQESNQWYDEGGVMIISYNLFCSLLSKKKKDQTSNPYIKFLQDPGPDLVVADEAHVMRNRASQINKALAKIRTKRRIALTGSPLQNNLNEYWCMVNWVRERYLYSEPEFQERFVLPIIAGQSDDSTAEERTQMKKRIHVLNKRLQNIVDRKDISILLKDLPPKREFVVIMRQHPVQKYLSEIFWKLCVNNSNNDPKAAVLAAAGGWRRICDHPACLVLLMEKVNEKQQSKEEQRRLSSFTVDSKKLAHIAKTLQPVVRRIEDYLQQQNESLAMTEESNTIDGHDDESSPMEEVEDKILSQCSLSPTPRRQSSSSPTSAAVVEAEPMDLQEDLEVAVEDVDLADATSSHDEDDHENLKTNLSIKADWWTNLPQATSSSTDQQQQAIDLSASAPVSNLKPLDVLEMLELGPKIILFLELLIACSNSGDKVILFSQSIEALNLIEIILKSENWGALIGAEERSHSSFIGSHRSKYSRWQKQMEYLRLDGSTSSKDRQIDIDKFNSSTASSSTLKLYLISIKAGAMGINLYTANRVILLDCGWNPADDIQAIARSYRYGQRKSVFVYRLIASQSLEERMYRLQLRKEALAKRVVDAKMPNNVSSP
jgi:SNF2 family DNA or RNA helicase